jgi:hypothetical protein
VEPRADADDPTVLYVDVGAAESSDVRVHRDDRAPWIR